MAGARRAECTYTRLFDQKLKESIPGLYVPKLLDKADHIINVFRISTHIWSHYTMAIKNWVGIVVRMTASGCTS